VIEGKDKRDVEKNGKRNQKIIIRRIRVW